MRIYKFTFGGTWELFILSEDGKKGCIIGTKHKSYPIGHFESNWGGLTQIPKDESIIIKSNDNLFTNGNDVIIRHKRGGDKNDTQYTLIKKNNNISSHKVSPCFWIGGTIVFPIDVLPNQIFKPIKQIKFKSK